MLRTTTSKSFNGTSTINDASGSPIMVASMYATINEDGNVNINKTITNQDAYKQNKVEIQKDFDDFENLVYNNIDDTVTAEEVMDNE